MVESTTTRQVMTAGTHILAELHSCNVHKISYLAGVKQALGKAIERAKFITLGESFYQFKPYGVTGIILLSESHISVHTWPEREYAAIDIFSCSGAEKAEIAFKELVKEFESKRVVRKKVIRGE